MIVSDAEAPPEADKLDGAPHPRFANQVFGHMQAEAEFLSAFTADRMHHAWMITGPKGIGKATLAWRLARFLLATPDDDGGMFAAPVPQTLDVAADHPVARRMAALAEPRMFLLRRPWNSKTEKISTQITIDETRKLKGFFQMSAADGGRRAVIVDAADEMNVSAANALLKVLEEPPDRSTLLLVSHQPARLLPTIRSRCRMLRLNPLGSDDLAFALDQTGLVTEDGAGLHRLAQGSVGEAVALAEAGGPALYSQLVALFASLPDLDRAAAQRLAQSNTSEMQFSLVLKLIDRILARLARTGATGQAPPEIIAGEADMLRRLAPNPAACKDWAARCEGLTARARRGRAVNLDPSLLILDMCLALQPGA
ncbi:MAG: DNA polymerase III subunit delta' [Pseudomonadota bacterium]